MNKAIEQFLNKPARRHSCQKDKPEPCTEQGKHKETIHKEAERLPQYNVNRDSDDKQNSIVSQEMMDTDQCIQRLIRSEPEDSDCAQRKIEDNTQYWAVTSMDADLNTYPILIPPVSNTFHFCHHPQPHHSQPYHTQSIIHHQWQLPILSLLNYHLDFLDIQ